MPNFEHMNVEIIDSARKHGVKDYDMLYVLENYIGSFVIENEPELKIEFVGFDTTGKVLEIITVEVLETKILIIHAMKATKTTLERAGLL
jgi:hypothetical protein